MMHQMLFVLFALQSYVVTATIPPGYALQEHLCSGHLRLDLNTNLVLSDGEHRISSGPPCLVSKRGNISIVGSSMKNTTVHCEGEGRVFEFIFAQTLSTERITFINCGIRLISIENILIMECTFQDSSNTAIVAESVYYWSSITIEYCLFINNNGGGVWLNLSTGNVSISNCTFQNNTATDGYAGGGGVRLRSSTGDVIISISHCTFQNNTATHGGGVRLDLSTGNVSISNCTFQNNTATDDFVGGGGGVWLQFWTTANVSISHCTFQNNTATYMYGGGVSLKLSNGNISISHCTFQNNIATTGGGGVWLQLFAHSGGGDIGITNCTFQNNSATKGGGAVFSWVGVFNNILNINADVELILSASDVNITNCTFHNNRATYGGAIFYVSIRSTLISGSTFTNNTAIGGAAVYAINSYNPFINHYEQLFTLQVEPFGHLILQGVMVKDNHCSCNDYDELRGGAIYFNGMKVDIFGSTFTGSQFSSNSPLGAIQGANGFLNLHGNITFSNNTGVNGGAISLSNNVPLYFYEGCAVEFSRNAATGFGGALYNAGDKEKVILKTSKLIKCTIRLIKDCTDFFCDFHTNMFSITFVDNHAQQGGHSVYATPIYNCNNCIGVIESGDLVTESGICPNLTSYITTTPSHKDINDIQLLSFPKYVHLCGCSNPNLCNATNQYHAPSSI